MISNTFDLEAIFHVFKELCKHHRKNNKCVGCPISTVCGKYFFGKPAFWDEKDFPDVVIGVDIVKK